ncbi:MAG: esterase/lipase family protein, partial [Solirubrobacterales bacterium]
MRRTLPLVLLVLTMLIAAGPARAELPVIYSGAYGYAHVSPTASPPGANDWSCKPSAAHPRPVVLVHGTFADMSDSWQALSPLLKNNGWCVFALNYGSYAGSGAIGVYGVGEIRNSAQELSAFVDKVLAATGAGEVDMVGHSQGGMMPRYYLKFLGGAEKVHTLVGLSPSNHGTTVDGIGVLARFFPGGEQFT